MKQPKLHIPFSERLKTIPEVFGIRVNEEPEYEVLRADGDFELRRYHPQVRATMTLQAHDVEQFRETAFRGLAGYIFGADIPMTAPVLQEQSAPDRWTMSFILPAKYTMETAPRPTDPRVQLEAVPVHDVAVHGYSGNNSADKISLHRDHLEQWITKNDGLTAVGNYFTAQYDAPFVIPFMKRNEIQVRVFGLQ